MSSDFASGDWTPLAFEECVETELSPRKLSIQQRDYKPAGRYPIVDQGAALIAGYCDDDTVVYRDELPLILFGDHTRVFKFLDFPFATGADGTKLLRPNPDRVDPHFLYYALRSLDLPNRGYNRHFRLLREQVIHVPNDREEQKRIASVLRTVESRYSVESTICEKLAALQSATMAKLFREGLRGEPLKQTEIGEIPQSWEVLRLGDVAHVSTGTTPATDRPDYYDGDIPFVKTAEIDGQLITETATHVCQQAVDDCRLKLYPAGTVFLAMYGQGKTRGQSALLATAAATTQNTAAIQCSLHLSPSYLWHYLDFRYVDLRGIGNLGHLSHLNLGYVKELLIPVPDRVHQQQITDAFDLLRRRAELAKHRASALDRLFRATLSSLMRAEIKVTALNVEEISHG